MKIALGLEYPLTLRGGVSVLVEKLIEGISPSYEVVLISPDPAGFTHPGICAHVRWDPGAITRESSKRLAQQLAELGVSLVHLHAGGNFGWGWRIPGRSPMPFLKRHGIACVSTVHVVLSVLDGYCDPKKPAWFKAALLPLAWLGKLDALRILRSEIVISQKGCARVRRWYWPMRSRFQCIYHSRLEGTPPALDTPRERIVLCVGHLAWRKGQHTLASAFARIAAKYPEWKLIIIGGEGSDGCAAEVRRTIEEHKLEERMLLLGSRDDALEWMRRAAIFVQPSTFEGLPLALQEAMYYGCACIATHVPGNDELIVQDRTGLFVPALNTDSLATALETLTRDPSLQRAMGKAASASIIERGMNAPTMVARHQQLYSTILGEAPSRTDSAHGVEPVRGNIVTRVTL